MECLRAENRISDEQQENTDKSRHDGKIRRKSIFILIVEHCICQGCELKNVDYQPVAEMLGRFRQTQIANEMFSL